jgi:hypothetical protein
MDGRALGPNVRFEREAELHCARGLQNRNRNRSAGRGGSWRAGMLARLAILAYMDVIVIVPAVMAIVARGRQWRARIYLRRSGLIASSLWFHQLMSTEPTEELLDLVGRQRFAIQKSLDLSTTFKIEPVHLSFRFDSLCGSHYSKART